MTTTYEIQSATRNKIVLTRIKNKFHFLEYSARYTRVNAFNLAVMAKASYLPGRDPIREFLIGKCTPDNRRAEFFETGNVFSSFHADSPDDYQTIVEEFKFKEDPKTETQLFHFETTDYLLIAVRGTEPKKWKDWKSDFDCGFVDFPEGIGRVHQGFRKAFNAIQAFIDEAVPKKPDKPVIICGHSLGGACATLVAAYLTHKHKRKVMLYTFGSPLVGDSAFVRHFTEVEPFIYYRIVNNKDLVSMIPPPHTNLRVNLLALSIGNPALLLPATLDPFGKPYSHMGKLVFIRRLEDRSFSVDVEKKTPAYIRLPSDMPFLEERPTWDALLNRLRFSIHDHFMPNYLSILGSDLKWAVDSYLGAAKAGKENPKKVLEYLDAEIKSLRERRLQNEAEMRRPYESAPQDAVATSTTQSGKLNPNERMALIEEALRNKELELAAQRNVISISTAKGFSDSVLKSISGLPMSPGLHRELEYQSANIRY